MPIGEDAEATLVTMVHAKVSGHLRLKVRGLRYSEARKTYLESTITYLNGVQKVSASTVTGNILIRYDDNVVKTRHLIETVERLAQHAGDIETTLTGDGNGHQQKLKRHSNNWYRLKGEDVLSILDSRTEEGLTKDQARQRLFRYGPNVIALNKRRPQLQIFTNQFKSLPVALLGGSAVLSVATGGVADAVVILGVIATNAALGFVTENQVETTIHSLGKDGKQHAVVIRDGQTMRIPRNEIVPGDLISLTRGQTVPADGRILRCDHLYVDESALTGESSVVLKTESPIMSELDALGDRKNMVFRGTIVTGGSAIAIAVGTGANTEIGRIQQMIGATRPPETPMQRELRRTGHQMVWISSAVCGGVFALGLIRGYRLVDMLKSSISLAIAAVPEGLPTVATTTLSAGVRKLREENVLVRHLDAVETIGGVQVICLDKTGTLTLNRMKVTCIVCGDTTTELNEQAIDSPDSHLQKIFEIVTLCNEADWERETGQEPVLVGSPTEKALLRGALAVGLDIDKVRDSFPLEKIQSRTERKNYMISQHSRSKTGHLFALKGRPSEVLKLCSKQFKNGRVIKLSDKERNKIKDKNNQMAGQSLRVLGVAYRNTNGSSTDIESDFIWLGLVGMEDSLREGVEELMGEFQRAGIKTMMITGDQKPTAAAIGEVLKLSGDQPMRVVDAKELSKMTPEEMAKVASETHVFSRVNPSDKLKIVQSLQKNGQVVAMTGDGINDGPALKAADIGVAVGETGSGIARKVSDVVLLDDNLKSMLMAIKEGRTISDDIKKSIQFLLATNMSEIIVTFSSLAMGWGQPLSSMQLLWINLLSDIFPELALAVEPSEPGVLRRPPRDPQEPFINNKDMKRIAARGLIISLAGMGAYNYGLRRYGSGQKAQTIAFISLTTGQLLHTLNARSDDVSIFDPLFGNGKITLKPNPYLNWAVGAGFAMEFIGAFLPGARRFLGTTRISALDFGVSTLAGMVPYFAVEYRKAAHKQKTKPQRLESNSFNLINTKH